MRCRTGAVREGEPGRSSGDTKRRPGFSNGAVVAREKFGGRLMVLSRPSSWVCTTQRQQLLDAVNQLHALHTAGYVHGDIRAFNIIFLGTGARLIDFDVGGQAGISANFLIDGRVGSLGAPILKWHDWRTLIIVCFSFATSRSPV
jgi:hypothetical protein